jgi:hypothetical protein
VSLPANPAAPAADAVRTYLRSRWSALSAIDEQILNSMLLEVVRHSAGEELDQAKLLVELVEAVRLNSAGESAADCLRRAGGIASVLLETTPAAAKLRLHEAAIVLQWLMLDARQRTLPGDRKI